MESFGILVYLITSPFSPSYSLPQPVKIDTRNTSGKIIQKNIYGGIDMGLTVPMKGYSAHTQFTAPMVKMINTLENGFIMGNEEVKAAIRFARR